MGGWQNRYEQVRTPEEELASDIEFEEMMEMPTEEIDRIAEVEMQKYVEARNRTSPQVLYRLDRNVALASCIRARNIIANWYASGEPVPDDHFTRDLLRNAQMRLVRLRASRAAGYIRSAVQ